jgi:hypothetical protein
MIVRSDQFKREKNIRASRVIFLYFTRFFKKKTLLGGHLWNKFDDSRLITENFLSLKQELLLFLNEKRFLFQSILKLFNKNIFY